MKRLPSTDLNHILDHTRELWDDLRGERVFITGGTGFFGKWLLESLLWVNDRLHLDVRAAVLTRSPGSFIENVPHLAGHRAVSLIQGDVRSFDFPSGTFTHIIHAATESSEKLNLQNPLLMLDTIVEGTRHTLDFAQTCGAKRFLLTSSGAVYGRQPADMTHIPEDYMGSPDPLDRRSAYAEGKRLAEHLCSLYGSPSLEIKIARGFAFVGPYLPLDVHFAIGNFIRDALKGGPIVVKGDGTPYRSYLYAGDLAIWLWTILLRGQPCHPYNVGSDAQITIRQLAELVSEQFGKKIDVEILKRPAPGRPSQQYVPNIHRVKSELSLQILVPLDQAIIRTVRYFIGLSPS